MRENERKERREDKEIRKKMGKEGGKKEVKIRKKKYNHTNRNNLTL